MKSVLTGSLAVLGALFAVLLLAGGVIMASGALPKDRVKAAVQALKAPPAAKPSPETPASRPAESPLVNAGLIEEARQKLENDKAAFDRERRMAEAQLQAERAEIEALKGQVDMKLKVEGGRTGGVEGSGSAPAGKAPAPAASDKGTKAVAQISAKMPPKDVVQLLQQESEEAVVQVLKRMDPKQAGKVMTEMLAADPARAQRVEAAMRQGQNP